MRNNAAVKNLEIEDIYPMSDIEKGLIFHSLLNPDAPAYYGQSLYQLRDREFDPQRLKKTFARLAEKHHMLRTGFNMYDFEEPIHIVYKEIPPDIEHYDISHLEKDRQKEYIHRFMAEDRKKGFPIEKSEPLWKLRSFALGNDTVCLLWICHHAIIDGWSTASLFTEFINTYTRLKKNPNLTLEPLKSTYKEFIIEQMIEKTRSETVQFWKNELKGHKKQDFSRILGSNGHAGEVRHYTYYFASSLLRQLKDRARQYNTTLNNLCFAAYLYMLSVVSGENDIITGLGVNNRPLCEDGDKIIGCFLNLAPVRMKIPGQGSWKDYIRLVEEKLLQLKKYERLSLFEIITIIGEKSQAKNPLFDTAFNYVDFHVFKNLDHDHSQVRILPGNHTSLPVRGFGFSNVPLGFVVDISLGGFELGIEYLDSIFSKELIKSMCETFENILNKFIHEPETPRGNLEINPGFKAGGSARAKSKVSKINFNF